VDRKEKGENSVQKVLISLVGKPVAVQYHPAKYRLENEIVETDFFFLPLLQKIQPDKFLLLGTRDSIWDKVEEQQKEENFVFEKIIIPFSATEKDVWQIFEKMIHLHIRDAELYIDINHGFRSMPMAIFMAVLYFQAVRPDIHVKEIFYGNFEARDENQIAPVVRLQPLLNVNEWIRVANRFIHYGDGDLLLKKLEPFTHNHAVQQFYEKFDDLTSSLQLNFTVQVRRAAQRCQNAFKNDVRNYLKEHVLPFRLLEERIKNHLRNFIRYDKEWQSQLYLAKWFYQNRQYTQSLIVLRETMITFVAELVGEHPFQREVRENKINYLLNYQAASFDKKRVDEYFKHVNNTVAYPVIQEIQKLLRDNIFKEWCTLIDHIQVARNRVGHALTGGVGRGEWIDPRDSIRSLHQWIDSVERIFNYIDQFPCRKNECSWS